MANLSSSTEHFWPLICLDCQVHLSHLELSLICPECGKIYPVQDTVVCCVDKNNSFYESRYPPISLRFCPNEKSPWGLVLLYLFSMRYLWFIRKFTPLDSRILDVACGAGMHWLKTRGKVAGLDISFSSAQKMSRIYNIALQSSAFKIPVESGSIDTVVSKFFLEHVKIEEKQALLAEFRRVLKPGGWLITLQDCECDNPLWRWAKRDEYLFQKHFIENDGHYGLIYASQNLDLFQKAGFQVVQYHASNKTPLVTLSMLEWMQPYRNKMWLAKLLLPLASKINHNRYLNAFYTFGIGILDNLVEPFLPLDNARYLTCVCRVESK